MPFRDTVMEQLRAIEAGQARTDSPLRDARATWPLTRHLPTRNQTLPEADLAALAKKRKLLDRQCVAHERTSATP